MQTNQTIVNHFSTTPKLVQTNLATTPALPLSLLKGNFIFSFFPRSIIILPRGITQRVRAPLPPIAAQHAKKGGPRIGSRRRSGLSADSRA